MISLKLTRWFIGSVRFSVENGSPERFYTNCARAGLYLWNIAPSPRGGACIAVHCYHLLRPIAHRAGCRLRVRERRGLPFLLYHTRGHCGLWAGGAAFLLIFYFLSLHIWCVNVSGNSTVSAPQLENVLASAGLSQGTLKSSVNPKALAEKAMLRFPQIRWMSINLRGSSAEIVVQEKTVKPQISDLKGVCNIKASVTGQVLSMKVYAGSPMVKKGDAVVEGQLLVSAVVVDQMGGSTLTHASAVVTAETKHTLKAEIPLRFQRTIPTGHKLCRRNFDVFGACLPGSILGKPHGTWHVLAQKFDVSLFGTPLPLGMYEEQWEEVRNENASRTSEEAEALAEKQIDEQAKQLLKGGRVTGRKFTKKCNASTLSLTAELTCEEDIAKESEIFIK